MAKLCEVIKQKRTSGLVTCNIFHGQAVKPLKSALRSLGLRNIPDHLWVELSAKDAHAHLAKCLCRDLAYSSKIMSKPEASQLASAFLSQFSGSLKYLTNTSNFLEDGGWSYDPISNATIDTGVLVENNGLIGILWFEDED